MNIYYILNVVDRTTARWPTDRCFVNGHSGVATTFSLIDLIVQRVWKMALLGRLDNNIKRLEQNFRICMTMLIEWSQTKRLIVVLVLTLKPFGNSQHDLLFIDNWRNKPKMLINPNSFINNTKWTIMIHGKWLMTQSASLSMGPLFRLLYVMMIIYIHGGHGTGASPVQSLLEL